MLVQQELAPIPLNISLVIELYPLPVATGASRKVAPPLAWWLGGWVFSVRPHASLNLA